MGKKVTDFPAETGKKGGVGRPKKPKSRLRFPGHPRVYSTAKELAKAVDGYFASISRTQELRNALGEPVLNDAGKPVEEIHWIRPPQESALALHLGITSRTWTNYCDHEKNPDFADITDWAKQICRAYLEEQLITREKNVQGLIFNLQVNYGVSPQQRVEVSAGGSIEEYLASLTGGQEF